MDAYAKSGERRTGTHRPKISHIDGKIDNRTRQERQRDKQAVIDERRAIKKAARRELKRRMLEELD